MNNKKYKFEVYFKANGKIESKIYNADSKEEALQLYFNENKTIPILVLTAL